MKQTSNPQSITPSDTGNDSLHGVFSAVTAFLIWGMSPIYWKLLQQVPAFEILMHRMVWSFVFLIPLLQLRRGWGEFLAVLKNARLILLLCCSTLLISANWFTFIWAVNNDHVLEASLGYYINPLVNVLLGFIFLRERLRRAQTLAVLLVGIGVLNLTIRYGHIPWISLTLAFSFGFYTLVRKIAPVSALMGLAIETFLLSFPALAYLFYIDYAGSGSFGHQGIFNAFLIMGTALVTALPLLLYTIGARRLSLASTGFLQYIAPSCTFVLALLFFHEPISRLQILTFALVWIALAVYSIDTVRSSRECKNHINGDS